MATWLCLLFAGGAWGCTQRVGPGGDQVDTAPPAQLGPEIDTATRVDVVAETGADISGRFDMVVRAKAPTGDEVEIPLLAVVDQQGRVDSGEATVQMELRSPDSPDEAGAQMEEPAEVGAEGGFVAVVEGYTVSADAFGQLASDTDATVRLESQIADSGCFRGDATVTMTDVEIEQAPRPIEQVKLEGPFRAFREPGSCAEGSATDAGAAPSDLGDSNG